MPDYQIGTREEWQAARNELAKLETEHAELGQKVTEQRRQLPWVAVETPEPEQEVTQEVSANVRLDLDEALKSLAPAERMCVSLCYGAGFSHAEAAELLNAPLGTVKSHVKRGLEKLRTRLAPENGVVLEGRRGNG